MEAYQLNVASFLEASCRSTSLVICMQTNKKSQLYHHNSKQSAETASSRAILAEKSSTGWNIQAPGKKPYFQTTSCEKIAYHNKHSSHSKQSWCTWKCSSIASCVYRQIWALTFSGTASTGRVSMYHRMSLRTWSAGRFAPNICPGSGKYGVSTLSLPGMYLLWRKFFTLSMLTHPSGREHCIIQNNTSQVLHGNQ